MIVDVEVKDDMKTSRPVIAGVLAALAGFAIVQAYASPQPYGWGSMQMRGPGNGYMNHGTTCPMSMGSGMMSGMNTQWMNSQCQQNMGSHGNGMMAEQHNQQQCQQYMASGYGMTPEQCQTMYQHCRA